MNLPAKFRSSRLPKSFPVGATYVVEGHGGADGVFRVSSRYVVLPRGQRIDLPANVDRAPSQRALAAQSARQSLIKRRAVKGRTTAERVRKPASRKKFATGRGTVPENRR